MRRLFHAALGAALILGALVSSELLRAAPETSAVAPTDLPKKKKHRKKTPPTIAPLKAKHPHRPREKSSAPIIRRIRIIRRDIFDTRIPGEDKVIFRVVNALHISTKERAVRGQLLFKEGDRYNADIAKESERAVRSILQLRNVKVTPVPISPGTVDVLVIVHETWTTEPVFGLSGVGPTLNLKAGLRENNLFGMGKKASFFYRKNGAVVSRTLSYDDPRLLGTPLTMSGDYQDRGDGRTRSLDLEKPFSATITRWAARGDYLDDVSTNAQLDEHGNTLDNFVVQRKEANGSVGFSAGSTTRNIRRPHVGYGLLRKRMDRVSTGTREEDAFYHIVRVGYEWERVNFMTVNHIKQYDRDEDFTLGPALDIEGGAARHKWMPTSDNANFLKGKAWAGHSFGPSHFGVWTTKGEGLYRKEEWRGATIQSDLEYYNHFQPRQTLACHAGWAAIVNPGPLDVVTLGGDSGLRGYRINQFRGNKRVVGNIENRFFVLDDIVRFMSLGTVVFADAGYAWTAGKEMRMQDIRSDVGAGIRLYLNRTSQGHVLRFDLAYALKRVGEQKRLVFSFASSHAF